ncbi:virulence factor EsxA [Listeria monocytogenes FSL F2-208]|nr:virulence factor EsxA [Listeria monocytogenes FSL F2-208]
MSGQIRMSPSELRDRAKTYGQSGRDIEDILSRLSQLQDQLRSEWEGQAFVRFDEQFEQLNFDEQFEQLKPKVTEFANLMDQINDQLEKTANAVEEHDQQLSQNFGF